MNKTLQTVPNQIKTFQTVSNKIKTCTSQQDCATIVTEKVFDTRLLIVQ